MNVQALVEAWRHLEAEGARAAATWMVSRETFERLRQMSRRRRPRGWRRHLRRVKAAARRGPVSGVAQG